MSLLYYNFAFCLFLITANNVQGRRHLVHGRFTRNIEEYELSIPHELTADGEFASFSLPHYSGQKLTNSNKRKRDVEDPDVLHLGLHAANRLLHLILWPNYSLLSPDFVVEYRDPENVAKTKLHDLTDNMCYYTGKVADIDGSRAALSTCDGLVGYVTFNDQKYFVEPLEDHEANEEGHHLHVVYKRDSLEKSDDLDDLLEEIAREGGMKCRSSDDRTQLTDERIERSANVSYGDMYMETMIVCDKRFLEYHRDLNRQRYILTVANMAADYLHDTSLGQQLDLVVVRLLYLEKEEKELDLDVTHDAKKTLDSFCMWQEKFNPPDGNPAHADIVILLTRQDICHGSDCEVVGESYIGTPCKKRKNCAYCEDTGLELGLVMAHEIGHLLGALDDEPAKSGCPLIDENDNTPFIMSPSTNLSAIRWSKCSKKSISNTFNRGLGHCFFDRPPPTPYIPQPALPGVLYDWDAQCQLLVPGATQCPTEESRANICNELRCLKPAKGEENESVECFSEGKLPADGTKCDENMWCFQGKCVKLGQRPETVDGDWSSWSEWSPCTRTCGRGVSYALRECNNPLPANGGRYCDGDKIRYIICNSKDCPENATSFRQEQCDAYNNVPNEEGEKHKYKAFLNPEAPCSLWCITEDGENAELNTVVKDGTKCKPGTRNVCVNGECWKVGCDNMLNSAAVEDVCGTCNGDGTGCKLVQDTYKDLGNKDYMTVAVFPTGVRKIRIVELAPSQNVIAITDKTEKHFYLNGKYTEQNDGVYKFGKAEGVYTHSAPNQEKLTIKGPLTEDLIFKVLFLRRENVGYHYQYADMHPDNIEDAKFLWEVGEMGECSARCGGGLQIVHLDCVEEKTGKVSDSFCATLKQPERPTQHCNMHECKTRWKTGKWGQCDACKGKPGVQKRGVECVQENPNPVGEDILVEDDRCPEPAPGTTKVCSSKQPCKTKRYVHYIPHSHLGDVWIKMQPKPVRKRSLMNTTEDVIDLGVIDMSGTKAALPFACNTSFRGLDMEQSPSGDVSNYNKIKGTTVSPEPTYALDKQEQNASKLLIYPLKKTQEAAMKVIEPNNNKDPEDVELEGLEEDKKKIQTFKGDEAAKRFKELMRSGKNEMDAQLKKNVVNSTISTNVLNITTKSEVNSTTVKSSTT